MECILLKIHIIPFNPEDHSVKVDVIIPITQVGEKGLEKLKVANIKQLVRSSKFLACFVLAV